MDSRPWPHAPAHWTFEPGTYMLTAGTYLKAPLLASPDARDLVCTTLFSLAEAATFTLRAWAVMCNHYHVIFSTSLPNPPLTAFVRRLHGLTARELNRRSGATGRRVWFQYWDSRITYQPSLLARLRYVNQNAVHHHVVTDAATYPWCIAS